ncbi:Uncharacterised protein [uncultured archaeon]|nr:Uncharacterised protein [uncultured archaeon]
MKNLGTSDRLVRVILADLCILIAFFWMGRAWQMVLYLLAFVMVFQAATGVCGFYNLMGRNTCERIKRKDKKMVVVTAVLMVLVAGAGSYASVIMTKNILKEDLASIEEPYNLTLLSTEQDLRNESISRYELLNTSLGAFNKKYSDYDPFAVKFDEKFQGDMTNVSMIVKASRQDIFTGLLSDAHARLAVGKSLLQNIKKRDGLE